MTYKVRMQTMVGDLEFERRTERDARALASKLQRTCRTPVTVVESHTGRHVDPESIREDERRA